MSKPDEKVVTPSNESVEFTIDLALLEAARRRREELAQERTSALIASERLTEEDFAIRINTRS